MSLQHAILGFLSWGAMTGYDLKTQAFDKSVAHFWPADQAQIYRTLDKLAEQGLIEGEVEMQMDRPNRKIYTLTDAGRAELQQWLLKPQELPIHREPFLIQIFFGDHLRNAELIAQLDAQLAQHEQQLAVYEKIDIPTPDQLPDNWDRAVKLNALTLDMGKRLEQMYIDWIHVCKATIQALPDKTEVTVKFDPSGTNRP